MDCATGGFRALHSHVKAMKAASSRYAASSVSSDEGERLGTPRSPEITDVGLRGNQERLWEQEKNLNALRVRCVLGLLEQVAVLNEHQTLEVDSEIAYTERERNVRSMQCTLNDEMKRVAEKERNLDARILEITRLEARLHKALLEQEQKGTLEHQQSNYQNEREAVLELRERKLALSKARFDEKEKHLQTKERILNEKEAELADFQVELSRKGRENAERVKAVENECRASYTSRMADVEDARRELEIQQIRLQKREADVAYRERASAAQALALEEVQRQLHQQQMVQEDYLTLITQIQDRTEAATADCADDHCSTLDTAVRRSSQLRLASNAHTDFQFV
ncbi:hypothetical protein PHYSODRAFT_293944 [Phytophthora sojae]|uniref:Uncharacterized protein n=1 Tax=Phytophthora sojae (strain P6497) TaxID=1094619 RepID=G4YG34_PHYSP|nr:hypothetical protein PHYSODRAFT_293944 [Phytophthora sojae]EGZ28377.1 hypothetical protein PHYSODRAFT_293944 [Phytophthora sojae]|eukprot:XP_009515652.1 hypothetical protein PHYSODRAFT_293944 [Phytophthora sojae]